MVSTPSGDPKRDRGAPQPGQDSLRFDDAGCNEALRRPIERSLAQTPQSHARPHSIGPPCFSTVTVIKISHC